MNSILDSQISRTKPLFEYIKKQRENEKFVKTLEIAATFVLISFFLFFAIRPTVLTISSLLGDIESKKILKKELRTKINNVIQAQELFSQVQESYSVVNNSLPDSPRYYQAASQIQGEGVASATNIKDIVFGLSTSLVGNTLPDVRFYTVSLEVNGDFLPSTYLVSELTKNQRIMNIGSINFSRNQENKSPEASSGAFPASNNLKTRFSVKFYYWPDTNNEKK